MIDIGTRAWEGPRAAVTATAPSRRREAAESDWTALCAVGDITCLADRIVTPAGVLPLAGSAWTAIDLSRTDARMPGYAVLFTLVLFPFFMLGLLCLLIREHTTSGYVHVTVHSGGVSHSTAVPIRHPSQVHLVMSHVDYARRLSAWATTNAAPTSRLRR